MGKYYADGTVIRSYAALVGVTLAGLIETTMGSEDTAVLFTVGSTVKCLGTGGTVDHGAPGTRAAIRGESDGEETVCLSRDVADKLAAFARQAGRRRVYLFTSNRAPGSNGGLSVAAALEASYGDESINIRLWDVEGSDVRVSEDLKRAAMRERVARLAERGLIPPTVKPIESLMDSGAAQNAATDAPELPPGMGAAIEYAATYDPETMPAPAWVDEVTADVPTVTPNPHWACGTIYSPPCPTGEHAATRYAIGARVKTYAGYGEIRGESNGRVLVLHDGESQPRRIPPADVHPTDVRVRDWMHAAHTGMDAARDDATDYRRTGGVTRAALEYALTARAMGDTRFLVGERSDVRIAMPDREGNGASRHWTRVLNGTPYGFTAVTMPSGERRYSVSKYNGYCDDGTVERRMTALRFGCAWSPVHNITIPAGTVPTAETPLDPRTARVAADSMIDVFTPGGNAVTVAQVSADGTLAEVTGRLETDRVYAVHELSYSALDMYRAIGYRRSEQPFLYAADQITRGFEPDDFTHEGYTVSVKVMEDAESNPGGADCYSEADKAAWRNGDWRYVGFLLKLRTRDKGIVGEASLFGVESYGSIGFIADTLESLYEEAKPEPLAYAMNRDQRCVSIDYRTEGGFLICDTHHTSWLASDSRVCPVARQQGMTTVGPYTVRADGEVLTVQAESITAAFRLVRGMRPSATVITDTMGSEEAERTGREIAADLVALHAAIPRVPVDRETVRRASDMLAEYARTLRSDAARKRREAARDRERAGLATSDMGTWLDGAANAWERMARSDDARADEVEVMVRALNDAYNTSGEGN